MKKSKIAVISVDMHRGHLDPEVATLPLLPKERCDRVIQNTATLFDKLREMKIPIVHVVTIYRNSEEIISNPFWCMKNNEAGATRKGIDKHNLAGSPGTEIISQLYREGDYVVNTKKRYSSFYGTDLQFLLDKIGAKTLILTGINTSSCVLCTGFDATNRDYMVYFVEDCMDSMDGRNFHEAALNIMRQILGQVVNSNELLQKLDAERVRG